MVVENGIIGGYAFISFMFGYLAFKLRDNESIFTQITSLLFFSMSILFVNVLLYNLYLIIQNTVGISYLNNKIASSTINILMWVTSFILVLFLLVTLFDFIKLLYDITKKMFNNKRIT